MVRCAYPRSLIFEVYVAARCARTRTDERIHHLDPPTTEGCNGSRKHIYEKFDG